MLEELKEELKEDIEDDSEKTEIMTLKPEDVESYDFDYEMKYYKDFSSIEKLCCGQIECYEEMHRYRDDIVKYIVQKNGLQDEM